MDKFKAWLGGPIAHFLYHHKLLTVAIVLIALSITMSLPYYNYIKNILVELNISDDKIATYAEIGDYMGGVIATLLAFASTLLVMATFLQQRSASQKQAFDSKFIELLKIHRENVSSMKKRDSEGLQVFRELYKDFNHIYDLVTECHEVGYRLNQQQLIDITYLIVFFGVGETASNQLRRVLTKKCGYKISFVNNVIEILETEQIEVKEHNQRADIVNLKRRQMERYWVPYYGNQTLIGHYHRHLFQTIKFIDSQKFLSQKEKYFYAKTLRAQMSSYEIVMFYFNSLSVLGRKWEFELDEEVRNEFITKYNLIKNIPFGLSLVSPNQFYPKVKYELEDEIL